MRAFFCRGFLFSLRGGLLCLVFCMALFAGKTVVAEPSYAEIYEKVFKKPFVKTIQLYESNLVVNGRFFGRVTLLAAATG